MRPSPLFAVLFATSSWLGAQTASAQSSSASDDVPPLVVSTNMAEQSSPPDSLPPVTVNTRPPPEVAPFTTPRRPPLVLEPMYVPIVRASILGDAAGSTPTMLSEAQQSAIITRTRGVRLAIGNLAAFGGLVIGSGFTGLGIAVPLLLCGFTCSVGTSSFIAGLGATLVIGTTFLVPAAFVYGASRQGVRGSYWATFGGFWLGAVGAALFTGLSAFSGNGPFFQVMAVIASMFPFLGMSIGHELTATATREGGEQPRNASLSRGFPMIAVTHTSASVGWAAQF